jgi:two-component sensor histidine kinase
MVAEGHPIVVKVMADNGQIGSDVAVSLGLIVTELVINAIKYAFPAAKADALILVTYEIDGADWKLTVSDNGVGIHAGDGAGNTGLGTAIVQALVKQLGAVMESGSHPDGMKVSITRATFTSRMPAA